MSDVLWKDRPEKHDYPAARDYLSLLMEDKAAAALVGRLREAKLIRRKAKDILRASGLALLPKDNPHVARNLKKVGRGRPQSPILLVRGNLVRGIPLIVADGYHRVCAGWHIDENALIPCRMVAMRDV